MLDGWRQAEKDLEIRAVLQRAYADSGKTVEAIAAESGEHTETVRNWLNRYPPPVRALDVFWRATRDLRPLIRICEWHGQVPVENGFKLLRKVGGAGELRKREVRSMVALSRICESLETLLATYGPIGPIHRGAANAVLAQINEAVCELLAFSQYVKERSLG